MCRNRYVFTHVSNHGNKNFVQVTKIKTNYNDDRIIYSSWEIVLLNQHEQSYSNISNGFSAEWLLNSSGPFY